MLKRKSSRHQSGQRRAPDRIDRFFHVVAEHDLDTLGENRPRIRRRGIAPCVFLSPEALRLGNGYPL
jgi:hypothetical protein